MDYKYLCYSGTALPATFAIFPDVVSHKDVHVLISQMIDKEETNWEVRTAGSLQWDGLGAFKTADFGNDLDPNKNPDGEDVVVEPGDNEAEIMEAYFKEFGRARFVVLNGHFVLLNRWPLEEKVLRIEFLESLGMYAGTARVELHEMGGEQLFKVTDVDVEVDPLDAPDLSEEEVGRAVENILNTHVED